MKLSPGAASCDPFDALGLAGQRQNRIRYRSAGRVDDQAANGPLRLPHGRRDGKQDCR